MGSNPVVYFVLTKQTPVLNDTDPSREKGAVLELAQVESDEICS